MADLSTTYMGIPLRNPFIVASSSLTKTLDGVRSCAAAGAGAIVLKSLFEEQIAAETHELSKHAEDYSGYGEAYHYLQGYGMGLGPKDYLQLISDAKKEVDIPIFASLNCISSELWADYARQLENAGADAIELNVGLMPTLAKEEGPTIVDQHLRILHSVKETVSIPVAMKVGPYFTSFANIADRLTRDRVEAPAYSVGWFGRNRDVGKITWHGADALVLFNRFYKFDIDIDKMELVHGNPYSSQQEIHYTLRWLSLLTGKVPADLCASTGVHTGKDAIKALLAGAKVVQLCSTLFINSLGQIQQIEKDVRQWMDEKGYDKLADFRSKMSQINSENPSDYERLQYIKLFVGID